MRDVIRTAVPAASLRTTRPLSMSTERFCATIGRVTISFTGAPSGRFVPAASATPPWPRSTVWLIPESFPHVYVTGRLTLMRWRAPPIPRNRSQNSIVTPSHSSESTGDRSIILCCLWLAFGPERVDFPVARPNCLPGAMLSNVSLVRSSTFGEYVIHHMDVVLTNCDDIAALFGVLSKDPAGPKDRILRGSNLERRRRQARRDLKRGGTPKSRSRCHCRSCRWCEDDARWDRIFNEKFADPTYYSERSIRMASPLASL